MKNRLIILLAGVGVAVAVGCGKPPAPAAPPAPNLVGTVAPELDGALTWLNSTPVRLADCRGKVVLLEFYEYACVNCLRTLPYLQEWKRRYGPLGLVTIGIHTPQYEFSTNPKFVQTANARLRVDWPVAVDSDWAIANAYTNLFWPRIFLLDQTGKIRFDHTGEGAYPEAETMIQQLLTEIKPGTTFPAPMPPVESSDKPGAVCYPITPELYLGQARGKLGNPEAVGITTNAPVLFRLPDQRAEGQIYAVGQWATESEYLRHTRDVEQLSDSIVLKYRATEINVVMKPERIYWHQVFVQQNGRWLGKEVAGSDVLFDEDGRSYVRVDMPRMYNLTARQPYGTYELKLSVHGKGLSVYSFSFGTCEMPQTVEKLGSAQQQR